jgi:hypothetical protein
MWKLSMTPETKRSQVHNETREVIILIFGFINQPTRCGHKNCHPWYSNAKVMLLTSISPNPSTSANPTMYIYVNQHKFMPSHFTPFNEHSLYVLENVTFSSRLRLHSLYVQAQDVVSTCYYFFSPSSRHGCYSPL